MNESDASYAELANAAADAMAEGRLDDATELLEAALEHNFEPVAAEALGALDRSRAGELIDLVGVADTIRIDADDDGVFGTDLVVDASALEASPDSFVTAEVNIQPDDDFEEFDDDELEELDEHSSEMLAFGDVSPLDVSPNVPEAPPQRSAGARASEESGVRYVGGVTPPPPSHRQPSVPMDAQGDVPVESETMQGVPAFGASGPQPPQTSGAVRRSTVELNVQRTARHPAPRVHPETDILIDTGAALDDEGPEALDDAFIAEGVAETQEFPAPDATEELAVQHAEVDKADGARAEEPVPPPPLSADALSPSPGPVVNDVITDRHDAVEPGEFGALPVADLLSRARILFDRGDLASAINLYDEVLAAEPGNGEAMQRRRAADERMGLIRMAALEPLDRAPQANLVAASTATELTPQMMFLLTQADGVSTLHDLIDLSGLSTSEASLVLLSLIERELLRFV